MSQARTPVTLIYAFGLLAVGLVLVLMNYFGMFEGLWDPLFDVMKEIAKFFLG